MNKLTIILLYCLFPNLIFYTLNIENDKKSILAIASNFPIWVILSYFQLPKDHKLFFSKLRFMIALGFGLNSFLFIIFLTILTLLTAIVGSDHAHTYQYSFPLLLALSVYISLRFHQQEMERLNTHGLDYHYTKAPEDHSSAYGPENITMNETLRMLAILSLEPDVTEELLKKRYRELANLYHPDTLMNLSEDKLKVAEEEFKRIKNAYEVVLSQIKHGNL